jgi:hypothetical protein
VRTSADRCYGTELVRRNSFGLLFSLGNLDPSTSHSDEALIISSYIMGGTVP